MAADIALYVSKRLQRPAFAVICLMMAQMLVSLSDCHPEHVPMAARASNGAN
jgi:hypothetical protein